MPAGRPLSYRSEHVLDTAMHLFWRNGYGATSLQDLVGAMGLARSSFYQAFGSKRRLFLICLDRYQEATALDLTWRLESAATGREFIEDTLLWAIDEATETRLTPGVVLSSTPPTNSHSAMPRWPSASPKGFDRYRSIFLAAAQRGRGDGSVRRDESAEVRGRLPGCRHERPANHGQGWQGPRGASGHGCDGVERGRSALLAKKGERMSVSYVEREEADELTQSFYDDAEERFEMLLNIFKVFGHTPKLGRHLHGVGDGDAPGFVSRLEDQGAPDPQGDAPQRLPILRRPARSGVAAARHHGREDRRHRGRQVPDEPALHGGRAGPTRSHRADRR